MTLKKILFIDRDGTLIEEPEDKQVDSLEKLVFMPGVFPALLKLKDIGYRFVMVTNQDGLGTESFPQEQFEQVQNKVVKTFKDQGICFDQILVCPHTPEDGCMCRKPHLGMVRSILAEGNLDTEKSYVIGDRDTDLLLAENMGIKGLRISEQLSWSAIAEELVSLPRKATCQRNTRETQIKATINLDSQSQSHISTGLGFFDHMIEQLCRHGGFSCDLSVKGDLHIDEHHVIEDTALVLGETLRKALGDKVGINRFGFVLPMDETEARVSIDLSGRPFIKFEGNLNREKVGDMPTEMVPHFYRSLSESLGATLHINLEGENAHHLVESSFKAVGRALRMAITKNQETTVPSTKGAL